ncbi:tRNA CCA-pyrophosphorylase [Apilactobacillus ozensis DSM 23829 = JCM 17196]|uniref:CCA-adding enzyme n=1 Tax=Apilactobacillus ozensis DSM 23829 = JCM 17196 TaxID=1423781 RepID=A0A0R2AMI5_9LACO|nr:CCA tRNA nucleotidyltransferase [Apilactobacillus ozensis]KRM67877.1 tRNA CCA-pyrophosphorylase [Apilactobacillus ozensis DSM 23829 = JCM 17196]
MQIKNLPREFEIARPIVQNIEEAGFEAYFVGGSVRDTVLGLDIHDVDIASSAYPAEIKKIFKHTVDTGIEHGTVMVLDHGNGYEITTFRTESGYQDYRRPDKVTFVRSLAEDLKRRDFTINALAMKENGEIIDLFDGLTDLKNNLIKAVGNPEERFHEDALRMMRAVRFASKLDFMVEVNTLNAIKNHSELLEKIAVERIHTEFVKMMLGKNPLKGIKDMLNTNLCNYIPGFKNHLSEFKSVLNINNLYLENESQVWTLICYQFGLNTKQIKSFLKAWKTSNQIIGNVTTMVCALRAIQTKSLDNMLMYHTGRTLLNSTVQLALILGMSIDANEIISEYDSLTVKSRDEIKINGSRLMSLGLVKPGPIIGKLLNAIELNIVNKALMNNEDSIIEFTKKFLKE